MQTVQPRRHFRHSSTPTLLRGTIKSDSDPKRIYEVEIDVSSLTSSCTCPAGQHGQTCKHVTRLLSRNISRIKRGMLPGGAL